jgi:steroid delta-isomerase-like uncharacterized protein
MDNSTIARQLYSSWNERDFDRTAELMADDGEIVLVGSGTRFVGPEGVKEFDHMWADAFPDGEVEIDELISAGDTVVVQYTGRGTQTGPLRSPAGEIPATGRSVTLQLCDVIRFENGKIASLLTYFDSASLLTQLGVMPGAGVATA